MTQVEPITSTETTQPATNDGVFSQEAQKKVLSLIERNEGSLVMAMLLPVKDAVEGWLGVKFGKEKNWAAVVDARTKVREGTIHTVPEAANDSIHQTDKEKKAA